MTNFLFFPKQKTTNMVSKNFAENYPQANKSKLLSSEVETAISKFILSASFSTATILFLLPYVHQDGNYQVPTKLFRSSPLAFHAFVIFLIFAFSGSYIALLFPDEPKISRLCGCFSFVSMASSVALVVLMAIVNYCSFCNLLYLWN